MRFDRNKHVYFNYSDFASSYEPFSQALKNFDYVLWGSKKLPEEERCKQNDNWSGASKMSILPLPIFGPDLV